MRAPYLFNTVLLPSEGEGIAQHGKEEIKAMAQFYGSEATVAYDGDPLCMKLC